MEKYIKNSKAKIFNGNGKLFSKDYNDISHLDYEGYFVNEKKEGKGIQYYLTGEKYYEGNFKNNEISGYGVKYYKNGAKRIEGMFSKNECDGKYYNPNNKEIYNGKIINDIPYNSENIKIYNEEGFNIYKGKILNGKYSGKGIEYSNYIEDMILYEGDFLNNNPILEIKNNEKNWRTVSVYFYSDEYLGIDYLINQLSDEPLFGTTITTLGSDFKYTSYYYNDCIYRLSLINSRLFIRFKSSLDYQIRDAKIFIYLFDLSKKNDINIDLLKDIKNNIIPDKKPIIYCVGNNINKTRKYVDNYREQAKELIYDRLINKYVELNIGSGEGCEILLKNLKIDGIMISDNLYKKYYEDFLLQFNNNNLKTLQKYINY